jgi:quercetin 2,3-dioxygenase
MNPILKISQLGFPWTTVDPFLMCVHHVDHYPKANDQFGPAASLMGHRLGQDFFNEDGWRMYHGTSVPGFPAHPHRGFETVTIVRRGFIDHSDSLGAAARFGPGDVQWLTAGSGVVHSEMFPLLKKDEPNPLELFQIWLNLPAAKKLVPPRFTTFWSEDIPRHMHKDSSGACTEIVCVAGQLVDGATIVPLAPPVDSWAAEEGSDLAIWIVTMEPGATWNLPAASGQKTKRNLYFFAGSQISIGNQVIGDPKSIDLQANQSVPIVNGDTKAEFLLLQGRPIDEPVAQAGPFVMNSQLELQQAYVDYQKTNFGGWPWRTDAPVHGGDPIRFVRLPDGSIEKKPV